MSMGIGSASSDDGLGPILESFIERYRRGERPSIEALAAQHAEHADEIRELLPAMVEMEGAGSLVEQARPVRTVVEPEEGLPFERLGDYRLLRQVGEGGMGVVFEAIRESLQSHVALKVIRERYRQDSKYLRRFRVEARSAASLHHTNIVSVFDFGDHDGVCYYAMQYIVGQGLDRVLKDVRRLRRAERGQPESLDATVKQTGDELSRSIAVGMVTGRFETPKAGEPESGLTEAIPEGETETSPVSANVEDGAEGAHSGALPPSGRDRVEDASTSSMAGQAKSDYFLEVARLGAQVADALGYAHKRGVLHRDIKPSNILLDAAGNAWITDFGLAKFEEGDDPSHSRDLEGTLRYMAPERFQGISDRRCDVYALGATLYEMVALRPAFGDHDPLRLIQSIMHEAPIPLRQLDRRISRDLETIIHKAMAKEPRDRFARAEEMADELRSYLAGRPIKSRPISAPERLLRWAQRNPIVAGLNVLAAVLTITIAVVSTLAAARNGRLAADLKGQRDALAVAERGARLGQAEALVGQAHGNRYSKREGQRFKALSALRDAARIGRDLGQPASWFDGLRNEAIGAMALPDMYVSQEWEGKPEGTDRMAAADDLSVYAFTDDQGAVHVRRIGEEHDRFTIEGDGNKAWCWLSPDGRHLVLNRDNRVSTVFALLPGGPTEILRADHVHWMSFMERPEGRRVVFAHMDGSLSVYDLRDGSRKGSFPASGMTNSIGVLAHPSEPLVVVWSYLHPTVEVRDIRTGAVVVREDPPWAGGCTAAWHPSGRYLLIGQSDGSETRVYALDSATYQLKYERSIACNHGDARYAFDQAGDLMFATGWGTDVSAYDFWTGRELFRTKSGKASENPSVSSEGDRVGLCQIPESPTRVGIWSTAPGRESRLIAPTSEPERSRPAKTHVAVHPEGRLATQCTLDAICLYELDTGRQLGTIRFPERKSNIYCSFDASGNLYTNGFQGAFRWPVKTDPSVPGRYTIGPPEPLPFHPGDRRLRASGDGRVLAQAMYNGYGMSQFAGLWIIHPDYPVARRIEPGLSVQTCYVSPDGLWIASNGWNGDVVVLDARSTNPVARLPSNGFCRFSPDGQLLYVAGPTSYVVRTGTWEKLVDLGPGSVHDGSPDNRLAALNLPGGVYRLVEVATGRELARLEDPEGRGGLAHFTPDGTRLVVEQSDGMRVWDLRRIRRELAGMGLDWDAPAYPAEPARAGPAPELTVELIGVDILADPVKLARRTGEMLARQVADNPRNAGWHVLLGDHLAEQGQTEAAFEAYDRALGLEGATPAILLQRTRMAARLKRWALVIEDATAILEKEPENHRASFLRAQAYGRVGRHAEAIRELTPHIELHPQEWMLYGTRAESYEGLGEQEKARADRDKGVALASAMELNNAAWKLVVPTGDADNARQALWLIRHALEKEPGNALWMNTLGVVQYRNGLYAEAVQTLNQSLAAGKGEADAFDLYFLAMSHARLGNAAQARDCYERAVRWVEGKTDLTPQYVQELTGFRAEAERELGKHAQRERRGDAAEAP